MAGYKELGFQDRQAAAHKAKAAALAKLKAKPPLDPEVVAKKIADAKAREEKLQARKAERAAAKLAKEQEAEAAAKAIVEKIELTEAQRKEARDARYAARKAKKSRR